MTAQYLLYRTHKVQPRDYVLIRAAAGGWAISSVVGRVISEPPVRSKKTGELTEDPGFAEQQPHIARSFTGSVDQNFSSPARAKSRGWRDWWIVRALSATRPSGAATARSQTAEADGCTIVTGG